MSRLPRFGDYRYIGLRDEMVFYDCDDDEQFDELRALVEEGDLVRRNRIQTFAPDEPFEAVNRGFKALRVRRPRTDPADFWAGRT